jgi:hypothetical protein
LIIEVPHIASAQIRLDFYGESCNLKVCPSTVPSLHDSLYVALGVFKLPLHADVGVYILT